MSWESPAASPAACTSRSFSWLSFSRARLSSMAYSASPRGLSGNSILGIMIDWSCTEPPLSVWYSMKFMEYQTLRGGSVQLQSIMMPKIEFPDSPRGDALYAMELSLDLEKLLEVHAAGEAAGDSQLMDFVESEFLEDQLNSI